MSSADPTELDKLLGEWTGTWDHERLFEELKEAGYAIVSYKLKPGDRWIDAQDLEHHNTMYRRWRGVMGDDYQRPPSHYLTCPGCGEQVSQIEAYRDSVLPFHWNEQGGGHTMERAYYGPHQITAHTGKQAWCLGEGFCKLCDESEPIKVWHSFDHGDGTGEFVHVDQTIPYALVDNPPTEGS